MNRIGRFWNSIALVCVSLAPQLLLAAPSPTPTSTPSPTPTPPKKQCCYCVYGDYVPGCDPVDRFRNDCRAWLNSPTNSDCDVSNMWREANWDDDMLNNSQVGCTGEIRFAFYGHGSPAACCNIVPMLNTCLASSPYCTGLVADFNACSYFSRPQDAAAVAAALKAAHPNVEFTVIAEQCLAGGLCTSETRYVIKQGEIQVTYPPCKAAGSFCYFDLSGPVNNNLICMDGANQTGQWCCRDSSSTSAWPELGVVGGKWNPPGVPCPPPPPPSPTPTPSATPGR